MDIDVDDVDRDTGNKNGKSLTRAMILRASTRPKGSNMSQDVYLGQITHLHLQSKKIKTIDKLECCPNLRVLYLYDNRIEIIENIEHAKSLSYLYLENNQIKKCIDFQNTKLKKLFLDENCIDYVKGLNVCTSLSHLSVARQRIPKFSFVSFESSSLLTISATLQFLDISGNGITQLNQFYVLSNLTKFLCSDNNISDISEAEGMVSLPLLDEVTFHRNPMCSLRHYRDYIIGAASDSLTLLDDVPVSKRHLIAIKGLQTLRKKIGLDERSDVSRGNSKGGDNHRNLERGTSDTYSDYDGFDENREDISIGDNSRNSNGPQYVETQFSVEKY
jgi:hypothetical protein